MYSVRIILYLQELFLLAYSSKYFRHTMGVGEVRSANEQYSSYFYDYALNGKIHVTSHKS